jgi:lyso-ornithine lipid O-acyltransferase
MSDLGALEPKVPVARSAGEAATAVPTWQVLGRCLSLVGAVASAIAQAGRRDSSALDFAARAQRTAATILHGNGITVRPVGEIPPAPSLLVCNHLGYLDALVIASIVPCIAIAKAETGRWPLFGAGLRALGVVFVARESPASGAIALRAALRALRKGARVLNFPEGTTTDGKSLEPFRRGSFGLAHLAGVPIIAARIAYDDQRVPWVGGEAFGPHYLRLARVPAITARVCFGEPIVARSSDGPDELAVRARRIIGELRP